MRVLIARVTAATLAGALMSGCSLLAGASVEDLQLEVGECIANPTVSAEGEQEVGELPVVDCAEPHDAEVYYTEEAADEAFPEDLAERADQICLDEFEGFVGVPVAESRYYVSALSPTSSSWDLGDRQIACLVVGEVGEELTGSLERAAA